MIRKSCRVLKLLLVVLTFCLSSTSAHAFSGSVQFDLRQRFFADDRFGNVNGFSEWWALEYGLTLGFYEFIRGLEPVVSFSFTKNRSTACVLSDDGENCLLQNSAPIESEDSFEYFILGFGTGLQYRIFDPSDFPLTPMIRTQLIWRYADVEKKTFAVNEETEVNGYDLGLDLLFGIEYSFFRSSRSRQEELESGFDLKNYSAGLHVNYLPAGFLKKGLGSISSTGGWAFGFGLGADW